MHVSTESPTNHSLFYSVKDIVTMNKYSVAINGGEESLTVCGVKQRGKQLEVKTYVTVGDALPLVTAEKLLCTVYDGQGNSVIQVEYAVTNPQLECMDLSSDEDQVLVLIFKYQVLNVRAIACRQTAE